MSGSFVISPPEYRENCTASSNATTTTVHIYLFLKANEVLYICIVESTSGSLNGTYLGFPWVVPELQKFTESHQGQQFLSPVTVSRVKFKETSNPMLPQRYDRYRLSREDGGQITICNPLDVMLQILVGDDRDVGLKALLVGYPVEAEAQQVLRITVLLQNPPQGLLLDHSGVPCHRLELFYHSVHIYLGHLLQHLQQL